MIPERKDLPGNLRTPRDMRIEIEKTPDRVERRFPFGFGAGAVRAPALKVSGSGVGIGRVLPGDSSHGRWELRYGTVAENTGDTLSTIDYGSMTFSPSPYRLGLRVSPLR